MITTPNFKFTPGTLTITFTASTSTAGWKDTQGDLGQALTQTFLIQGPTASLTNPAAGGSVDASAINNRHYIDITLPVPTDLPSGYSYSIDPASVETTTPKFTFSGTGVGTAAVDTSQAPIPTPNGAANTYRFWITGTFASDSVTVTIIPGSYSFTATGYTPASATGTVSPNGVLTLTLPTPPAGLAIDPNSVLRNYAALFSSLTLTGETITPAGQPTPVSTPNTFNFPVTISPAITAAASVTVAFNPGKLSFTDASATYGNPTFSSAMSANGRSYLDVTFQQVPGETLNTSAIAQATSAPFSLTGAVAPGVTVSAGPTQIASSMTSTTFRYYLSSTAGPFTTGTVTVSFAANGFSDSTTNNANVASTETFTVTGPTADLVNPGNNGGIGQAVVNGRGFLDVPFTVPAGATLSTAAILAATSVPFTLGGTDAAAGHFAVDAKQSPVLIGQMGTTYLFRYATLGMLTTNNVTIIFAAGAYSYTQADGTTATNAAATVSPVNASYTIGGNAVPTGNIGYIDVRFTPTTGDTLNLAAILAATSAPFTLGGSGLGTVTLVPFSTLAPLSLGGNVVRFYVTGDYATGPVTLGFAAGSFTSTSPSSVAAVSYGNLATTLTFNVQQLSATLADPVAGTTPGTDALNDLGYLDVTFTLPSYATSLDLASVESLTPKFTVTVNNPADGTLALDSSQPAILISHSGNAYTFRFWYSGTFRSAPSR